MEKEFIPQFICMNCKKVIGPIWDDVDNQCDCADPYEFEVWRVVPDTCLAELRVWAKERKSAETDNRPDINIHKRTLVETWNQVIREIERRMYNPALKSDGANAVSCSCADELGQCSHCQEMKHGV